ncbi:cytoplasmic protein [Fictibacillus enclensis]|uniref:cytoplasmic protein n=1 Tax=Fictibacillus enclensis TaxID=1017270 RepID=UPI0024C01898|nr:cytoplasmic protein [Fictibacillus enclensis]WHY70166.1 cytoplasmic protein [Fictibacillus enclensis]
MQTEEYSLVLRKKQEADTVKKQCKMCGKVTIFTDTTIQRHNANGKNIYQFAIYKCPKNHSWNKKLDIYKSFSEHVDPANLVATELIQHGEKISLFISTETSCEINISSVEGSFRLDRTLADYIEDWSRTEIVQKIKNGEILLNNRVTKPSQKLSFLDKILIVVK